MCLSIFLLALAFLSNLLNTLNLLIQIILVGNLAFLVPYLFPKPVCLPFDFAYLTFLILDLE